MKTNPNGDQAGEHGFGSDFRRFFVRGLSGLVPPLVTLAILIWAYNFIDRNIGQYVTNGLQRFMASVKPGVDLVTDADVLKYGEPIDEFDKDGRRLTREFRLLAHPMASAEVKNRVAWVILTRKYHINVLGFVLAIMMIYLVGYFLASFIGKSTWQILERGLFRVPLVKAVYPHVKQVTDLVLSEKKLDVSEVVAVEFPKPGMWALGLVVGKGLGPIERHCREEMLTVFIMSSPTPFTGYPLCVRRSQVIEVAISLDEALRFVVSCGVVAPGADRSIELRTQSPWRSPDDPKLPEKTPADV